MTILSEINHIKQYKRNDFNSLQASLQASLQCLHPARRQSDTRLNPSCFRIDLFDRERLSGSIEVELSENCMIYACVRPDHRIMLWANHPDNPKLRWQLRLIPDPVGNVWHYLERGRLDGGKVRWCLPGKQFHTHRQLTRIVAPIHNACGRFGCFSQHGQLFDFKDWFAVSAGPHAITMVCPRPGCWTMQAHTAGTITGDDDSMQLTLPIPDGIPFRRNLLIAPTTLEQLEGNDCLGMQGYEQDLAVGHTRWAPRLIARYGYAHPARLANMDRLVRQQTWQRPAEPIIGNPQQLADAHLRVAEEPDLAAGNPYWCGQMNQAVAMMLDQLADALEALKDKAYLHPKGNPVYMRLLGPLMAMYNLLDVEGHLSDEQRNDGASMIAQLATLLYRRDFYPWDIAMLSREDTRSVESMYRGMLNQNFNTDRYVAVGLAGCVLSSHPHAARWRQHAIEQFRLQMQSFVYPGGCWEESHTYANHVKLTLLPLGVALQQADEGFDMFADERFAAMCRFFLPLLSPRQVDQQDCRLIPALGDHGYSHADYSFLFGWLSMVFPEENRQYRWAWQQTGCGGVHKSALQLTMFHPLLCPSRQGPSTPVSMPPLKVYPGYGACARQCESTQKESMLLVRCGEAWGHYHPDISSFWWWADNELIAADAQLGSGELKLKHHGHNVLGYVDHQPMLHLDRTPFAITDASLTANDQYVITCTIPIERWQLEHGQVQNIPLHDQPINIRTYQWHAPDRLTIMDRPMQSPNQQVTWSIHILADDVWQVAPEQFAFRLTVSGRTLTLTCPMPPLHVTCQRYLPTLGLTLIYPEVNMKHQLIIGKYHP